MLGKLRPILRIYFGTPWRVLIIGTVFPKNSVVLKAIGVEIMLFM